MSRGVYRHCNVCYFSDKNFKFIIFNNMYDCNMYLIVFDISRIKNHDLIKPIIVFTTLRVRGPSAHDSVHAVLYTFATLDIMA